MGSDSTVEGSTPVATSATPEPSFGEPGWRPYCLKCETMARMKPTEFGFICDPEHVETIPPALLAVAPDIRGRWGCGNTIKHDLTHYTPGADGPLEAQAQPSQAPLSELEI